MCLGDPSGYFHPLAIFRKESSCKFFLADAISGAEDTSPSWFFTFGSQGQNKYDARKNRYAQEFLFIRRLAG